jgi:hypothetical protein
MKTTQMENGKDQMIKKDDMMEQVKTAATSISPFDLGKLTLSQDFGGSDGGGVKKKIMTVPVRKPNKQSFFRVVPGDDFKITTAILELKDDGSEIYLIHPDLRDELAEDMNIVQIVTTIDRQNNVVLWPIKLPKSEGRSNTWNYHC